MPDQTSPHADVVRITHFTDVLCVWAYVSQVRIDELKSKFGARIAVDPRLFPVFGAAARKIGAQWSAKGGASGYNQHIRQVVGQFTHVSVHPDIWLRNVPPSSLPAHLFLSAIRLAESEGVLAQRSLERMTWKIREAFFAELQDVSDHSVLSALASDAGLPLAEIESRLKSGAAHAVLSEDLQLARDQVVRSSPTLTFNEDRQRLTGNVGYRIIEANVRELLERPVGQQSWC